MLSRQNPVLALVLFAALLCAASAPDGRAQDRQEQLTLESDNPEITLRDISDSKYRWDIEHVDDDIWFTWGGGTKLRMDWHGGLAISQDYANGSNAASIPREGLLVKGKVGIGTSSPKKKLDVKGIARAKEVIVETEGWSDYVFEEGYDLPTLEEVSAFIETKGHLPGVPSAESVEQNGLRLGEIDATLLQKIEELTLYTIKQRAYADSLEHRLSVQKARADSLSEQVQSLRNQLRKERGTRKKQIQRVQEQIDQLRKDRLPKKNR